MKTEMPDEIYVGRVPNYSHKLVAFDAEYSDGTKYVRADTIETLLQENATLKEKLDLCGKWQDVDLSQNNTNEFILLLKKGTHKEVGFCHISNGKIYSTTFVDPCEHNVVLKCIPLPEGTEGL